MKIGIDISQLAYQNTGVASYLENLVLKLIENKDHEFILFYSSLRQKIQNSKLKTQNKNSKVKIIEYKFPPSFLDLLWNKLHIVPIENFIGDVDIFITSDWTEPPTKKAKKATIIYDFIVYKYPEETHNRTDFKFRNFLLSPNIVKIQKQKLSWVKKESDVVFCISESTKKDAQEILGLNENKLKVIYPGLTL